MILLVGRDHTSRAAGENSVGEYCRQVATFETTTVIQPGQKWLKTEAQPDAVRT